MSSFLKRVVVLWKFVLNMFLLKDGNSKSPSQTHIKYSALQKEEDEFNQECEIEIISNIEPHHKTIKTKSKKYSALWISLLPLFGYSCFFLYKMLIAPRNSELLEEISKEPLLNIAIQTLLLFYTGTVLAHILIIIYHFIEELQCLTSYYNGEFIQVLKAVMNVKHLMINIFISILISIFLYYLIDIRFEEFIVTGFYILIYPIIYLLWKPRLINLQDNKVQTIGLAMAHGCYYTYYSQVLKGLKTRIDEFEAERKLNIYPRKLIILFPKSCRIAKNIGEWTNKRLINKTLEEYGKLKPIKTEWAGSPRIFDTYVYKLTSNTKTFYCLLNCPSNLLVLHDFINMSNEKTGLDTDMAKFQAKVFYEELTTLIETDTDCLDNYQPLKYTGINPKELIEKLEESFSKEEDNCV